jgi:hypothetical protein
MVNVLSSAFDPDQISLIFIRLIFQYEDNLDKLCVLKMINIPLAGHVCT